MGLKTFMNRRENHTITKCLSSLPTCSAVSPGGTQAYSSKAQPLSSSLGKPE